MAKLPVRAAAFLSGKRFAVAGVSRSPNESANLIFRKLRDSGYEVVPVNPGATTLEGATCYPDLASVPGALDGVVVATHPGVSAQVVRQAAARGIRHVWFHRSVDAGSVSEEAVKACAEAGIEPVLGGCPLMYCAPVDAGHLCMRWVLGLTGRLPR